MNREFLRNLGLEDEQVNAVMSRHGSTIGEKEDEIANLTREKDKLDRQYQKLKADNGDSELKQQVETLETEKTKLEEQITAQAKQHKLETYVGGLGVKDQAYILDKLADVELEDDEFVDIDERVEELKELHPLLFESEEPEQTEPPTPRPWGQRGNGTVGSGNWTKEKIMAVENTAERQRLIAENRDLF